MEEAEAPNVRGRSFLSGSTSSSPISQRASCVCDMAPLQQQQQMSTPLPSAAAAPVAAAAANASHHAGAAGALTSSHPASSLYPHENSSFSVVSPQAEAPAESFAAAGTAADNPFAFHARSRPLTSRTLLLHPPTFPSPFSAAAAPGTDEAGRETETSRRRVSSSFCSGKQSSNHLSSCTPFSRRRRDTGDGSLRLLLPPPPSEGVRIPSAAAVGQSVSTTDSSNSCTTDSSSTCTSDSSSCCTTNSSSTCTTDSSSHSCTVVGGSPVLSFSMPATPRLHFHSPGSPQAAGYIPFSGPEGAVLCTTVTAAAGGDTKAAAGSFPFSLPPAVIPESAAAVRAWPAKRRRSIHVDGSSAKGYTLPPEQQQHLLRATPAAGQQHQPTPTQQQPALTQQQWALTQQQRALTQQQNFVGMSAGRAGGGGARCSSSSSSERVRSTGSGVSWMLAQQQAQGATDYPPLTLMDYEAAATRLASAAAAAGEGTLQVTVKQPEEEDFGRAERAETAREDQGDVKGGICSPEEALVAEEEKANSLAVSDTEADGCNGSWTAKAVSSLGDLRVSSRAAAAVGAPGAAAEGEAGPQQRLEFLDSGCYSLCYHTAMAAVPYTALSTDSAAAQLLQQQQTLLFDREREARRRRKACLSVLRSVHNALLASPTREAQTFGAARRGSSPAAARHSAGASSLPPPVPGIESVSSSMKGSLHGDEFSFTAGVSGVSVQQQDKTSAADGDVAAAAATEIRGQDRGGTQLSRYAAAAVYPQYSFAAPSGVKCLSFPAPSFGTLQQQHQQQQFLLSVSPVCSSEGNQQQNTAMAADPDSSGRTAAAYSKAIAAPPLGAAREDVLASLEKQMREEPVVSQGASLTAFSNASGLLRLRPEWLSPYTLAALIGACVHCYDVVRAAYPPPEPPPRLCLVSLPALYSQLPPHLLAGAVLLDESALSLGSPPQCLPIECSLISLPSGQNSVTGGSRRNSSNSSSGSDKESWSNSGRTEGEEKRPDRLPGSLLGQFDIIVCETRSVTLATVENVAACVKALSRRRRRTRGGKKAVRRNAEAVMQRSSAQSRRGDDDGTFFGERKDVHMRSSTSDNEDEQKEKEDKEEGLEEEVDVAAAALGYLSLLKFGQSGDATMPEKQLKDQQLHQQQLQQQETFQRLPSSVRVIMLSTCLLSAVVDDLLGLKQCRFQPYVPSSALSSLQLQCIYTNFEDYPLFQKHNDFDFTTRVRARRRGTRCYKGGRRGRGTEGNENCGGGNQIGSGASSSRRKEARTGEAGGGPWDTGDTLVRDPLISRALILQAEQEARAAVHPTEVGAEVAFAHSTTNDEFSSEKSGAEDEIDDAPELIGGGQREELQRQSCQSCQRYRETTLLNAFEAFHLHSSTTMKLPQQLERQEQEQFMVPQLSQENAKGRVIFGPDACCEHSSRLSLEGNCQTTGGETNSSSEKKCEIPRSKAYRGITMRQGDDEEDDGIDYDLECGSHFGMVAHEL